jgi:hypothetical protein
MAGHSSSLCTTEKPKAPVSFCAFSVSFKKSYWFVSDERLFRLVMEQECLQKDVENICGLDDISSDLSKLNIQNDRNENFSIYIDGHCLQCNKELLQTNSKFFEAFFKFDPEKESIQVKKYVHC